MRQEKLEVVPLTGSEIIAGLEIFSQTDVVVGSEARQRVADIDRSHHPTVGAGRLTLDHGGGADALLRTSRLEAEKAANHDG